MMGETPYRCCAVVPLYDNATTVPKVVAGLQACFDTVIVVDDGSRDGGPSGIAPFPGLVVATHDRNRGKGAAVKTGVARARSLGFTHVLQVDADGQHDLGDLRRFLAASMLDPRAVLAGEREFDANAPKSSRFGRTFGMFWYRIETRGHPVTDTQCGYRVYPVDLFDQVPWGGDRMEFDVEILVRAVLAGVPVLGVPTRVRYGRKGEHRSHFRPFRDNLRMTWLHTRLTTRALVTLIPGVGSILASLDRSRARRNARRYDTPGGSC
jgi:glycosyltransferase involved in cell wall biosynthesis